jgi:putative phage-type endonuclease
MQTAKPKRTYTRKAKQPIVETSAEKAVPPASPKKRRMNEEYAKLLGELLTIMVKRGDNIRARVYRRAQETILSIPEDIYGPEDVAGKPGIGPTILEKLQTYEKTGTLNILEREKDNPENILSDVYGVGPKKAKELVAKGITTIAQLRERQSEVLNDVQRVGLKYYEDILEKIPRAEIDEYAKVFQSVYEKISKTTEMKYEIVGSYRRGVAFSGDIDVIITAKNATAFKEWINELIAQKNIIEVLSRGSSKCLVISRLAEGSRARRVDFLYTTPEEYPFAVLYFTGSKGFNATMRGYALKQGLSLNEHGLSKMVDKKKEEKLSLNIVDERGIFDYLGLVYKEPKSRVDGRAVVAKDGAAVVPIIDDGDNEIDIGEPGADIPKDPEKLEEFCTNLLQKKGKLVSSKKTLKKESIGELPKGPSIKKSKSTKLPPIKILPDSLKLNNVIDLNDLPKSPPKPIPITIPLSFDYKPSTDKPRTTPLVPSSGVLAKEPSIVNIEKGKKPRKPKTEKVAKEPQKNKSVKISKEPPIIIPSSPIQKINYEKLNSPKGLSKSPAKYIQIPEPKPPAKNKTAKLPKEPKIQKPLKTKTQKQKPQKTNIVDIPERGTSVGIASFSGETSNAFRRMKDIQSSIARINSIPETKQKTKEWYESRYGMLTASNIHKALGSESQKNSLIYEKCKPLTMDHSSGNINTENPMHWGVKYEPITAAIYEHMFSTTLSYYGCIPHAQYPFIGASPDGIVADPQHSRYGHMVEIKNIVNRDITGIPKEEYWVQMQVQLETCDLEYCDFIETRIKEYETAEQYYEDAEHSYNGVVLYFVRKMLVADAVQKYTVEDGKYNDPYYVYMPLDVPIEETTQWIADKRHELRDEYVLYKTNYWYLQEISCVIVQRNRDWFQAAVPSFISIWNTIERERVSGYDHRATVKKPKLIVEKRPESDDPDVSNDQVQSSGPRTFDNRMNGNVGTGGGICLIKLDESGSFY